MAAAPVPLNRPVRPAGLGHLTAWAGVLCATAFLAPFPVASAWPGGGYPDVTVLREAVSSALVRFWSAGGAHLGTDLAQAADFWARFHIVKATLAGLLLGVLGVLVARVWREFAYTLSRGRRWRLALAGVATAPLAVLALLVIVANLQGAIAPLSSVLGVLPLAAPGGRLAGTVSQIRHSLAIGAQAPSKDVLLHDFVVYHVAMAALGGAVTLGLLATAVVIWRRRAWVPSQDRPWRRVLAVAAVALVALGGIFGFVTAANASTAAHPVPALLAFFDGGL